MIVCCFFLECNIFERITQYNIALLSFSEGIGTNINCHKIIFFEHGKICQKFKFRIMTVILLYAEVSSFQIVVDHILCHKTKGMLIIINEGSVDEQQLHKTIP